MIPVGTERDFLRALEEEIAQKRQARLDAGQTTHLVPDVADIQMYMVGKLRAEITAACGCTGTTVHTYAGITSTSFGHILRVDAECAYHNLRVRAEHSLY